MKIRLYTGLILLFFIACTAFTQQYDLKISGSFQDLPFTEFATEAEKQTGATFYYVERWVAGVKINTSGSSLSLHDILNKALLPIGIYHYIDEFNNVYLTNDNPLIPLLPELARDGIINAGNTVKNGSESITSAEQRYIEGHKTGNLETLIVGDKQSAGNQSGAFVHGKIVDGETGEPLIGATIYLDDLKKGAATDVDGRFSLMLSQVSTG